MKILMKNILKTQYKFIEADMSSYKPPTYFINIKSISFHPYTLDEDHAWFHLFGLRRAVNNGK